jgi:CheY-like chemotaxis protein
MTQKILIVDDSKLARMAVNKALNSLRPDWTRIEASNSDEALALIRQAPPDIALIDFNMPGKDGLVLAAEIRQLAPQISLAVISANHQVEVIERARATGATFLPKPLTEKSLGDFLNSAAK